MNTEKLIKKVLRKWLKKKLFESRFPITQNVARFQWVYSSHLKEWRDRIWVAKKCCRGIGETGLDRYLEEYLYL